MRVAVIGDVHANLTALRAVPATAATDFTVKVVAAGLKPGTQYYYRFKVGDTVSPVGTFKTPYAPLSTVDIQGLAR